MQGPGRTVLMSFVGGAHGMHPHFRMLLHRQCAASEACLHMPCMGTELHKKCKRDNGAIARVLRRTTFCLEPDGDTPTRQSWFDAILSGCIPVFFSSCLREDLFYEHVYHPFLPAHTRTTFGAGDWAVVLNSSAVYGGTAVETLLKQIDPAEVVRMQARLAEIAPRVQYSLVKNTGTNARSILQNIVSALPS
jgi:hypothetical protein